ncbi:MAG TPA: DNA gyrase C-terminal beta-propeller domain-containing protein, partial [Anaerolineales bacterium]|nr:DNA gyrase C-terminal beta-propeller domain-containing protein [Anaerolineales bacterium]
ALQIFIEHRRLVIVRRSEFELTRARERAHILAGLLIALANLDDVITTIRQSPDADIAKERLVSRFNLSERQAQAILDMQLRRLAALERQKIEDEQRLTLERIAYLEDILQSPAKVLELIKSDLDEVIEKYNDERRTQIAHGASDVFNEEELVRDEAVLVSLTQRGYIKRVAAKAYRAQGRGGRGVTGHHMKDEDEILILLPANTLNTVLFFSNKGKVYSVKAYQIPEADRTGRGVPVVNILSLGAAETITAALAVPQFDQANFCVMATHRGRIKRLPLSELESVRPSGLIAMNLDANDELGWARQTNGKDDIILVTELGQALRYSEQEIRPTGRSSAGVTAIRLDKADAVTSMEVVEKDGYLLIVTTRGFGKRTSLTEYPVKGRATGGVQTIDKKALATIGRITSARVVQAADDLTMISANGVVLRTKVQAVSQSGRAARGVRVMEVGEGDSVASLARISDADLRQVGAGEE